MVGRVVSSLRRGFDWREHCDFSAEVGGGETVVLFLYIVRVRICCFGRPADFGLGTWAYGKGPAGQPEREVGAA
jgi:hypothetical protein